EARGPVDQAERIGGRQSGRDSDRRPSRRRWPEAPARRRAHGMGQQYVGPRELVSRGVSRRAVPVSRRYLIRRVLIASPVSSGSPSFCTPYWRWRRAARSTSWPPTCVPPEVAAALRTKLRLNDPVSLLALSVRHATGDWGFSFASHINVDTLIQGWLPTALIVIGAAQHSTNNRRTGVGHRVPSLRGRPHRPLARWLSSLRHLGHEWRSGGSQRQLSREQDTRSRTGVNWFRGPYMTP